MSIYEGVQENIYRYAWAYDSIDADAYVDCFAADGAVVVVTHKGETRVQGREALRGFFEKARGHRATLGQQPRHLITNLLVTQKGEHEAEAKCYMAFVRTHSDGSAAVDHAGRYLDRLVWEEGRWRFAERRILMDKDQAFRGRLVPPA